MLEHLFGSKTRLKLLQIFFREPDRYFYVRELARLADTQINAIRQGIANLEKLGIIALAEVDMAKLQEVGTERSKYYKLQRESVLFEELKALLVKSQVLAEEKLIEDLKRRVGQVKFLLLTGIFTECPDAETDILLVGDIKTVAASRLIKEFEKILGKSIRYTIMDEKEFLERREIGDRFLYNVFESKNLMPVRDLLEN